MKEKEGKKRGDSIKEKLTRGIKHVNKNIIRIALFAFLTISMIIFVIFTIILYFIPTSLEMSTTTTQYLLSAVIQSLAAILAIVVTLTLVAVQVASQTYTLRVMGRFIKNNWFWGLIGIYSFMIIFNLVLLVQIGTEPMVSSFYAIASISSVIMCLFYLILYIVVVVEQLNPETIIKDTLKEVDEDFLDQLEDKYYATGGFHQDLFLSFRDIKMVPYDKDPILALTYLAVKAIRNDDFAAARAVIEEINKRFLMFLNSGAIKKENEPYFSEYFLRHINRIGMASIDTHYRDIATYIIIVLMNIGRTAVKQKLEFTANKVIFFITSLSKEAIKERFYAPASIATSYLKFVGIEASKGGLGDITAYVVNSLNIIVNDALRSGESEDVYIAIDSLEGIGVETAERQLKYTDKLLKKERFVYEKVLDSIREIESYAKEYRSSIDEEALKGLVLLATQNIKKARKSKG